MRENTSMEIKQVKLDQIGIKIKAPIKLFSSIERKRAGQIR